MNFFYTIFIIIAITIILAIIILFIIKDEKKEYNENLKEIKNNYKLDPQKYFSRIILISKRQVINHEFEKFEKDVLPIIKDLINQEKFLSIENLLEEIKNYTHTYKFGSQMTSPSDYIDLNEKAWKIIDILEEIIIN